MDNAPPLTRQIVRPRCPRCGQGRLFADMLGVVDHCTVCDLSLKDHDAADGPAFFAITLVGFLVMGLAAVVEHRYEPPMWVHAAIWLPFTLIACVVALRLFKTILITIEYRLAILKETPHDPL